MFAVHGWQVASRATVFSERECFRASWLLTGVQHVLHSLSRFCGRTPSNAYTVTTAKAQAQDCSWETKLCSKTEWYFTTVLLCGQRIISQMHLGYSKIILTDPARKQKTESQQIPADWFSQVLQGWKGESLQWSRAVLLAVSRGQERLEKLSHRWCRDGWGPTKRPHSPQVQCRRLPSSQPHNCRVLTPSCLLLE